MPGCVLVLLVLLLQQNTGMRLTPYHLLGVNIEKIDKRARENVRKVCDTLQSSYNTPLTDAEDVLLVRNCEDLLYHAKEVDEASSWPVDGVDVISGHYNQVITELKKLEHVELEKPIIVLSCDLVAKMQTDLEQTGVDLMKILATKRMPVLVFDRLVWWNTGAKFTFEPPFGLQKFPADPNAKRANVKNRENVKEQDDLEYIARKQRGNANLVEGDDYTIEMNGNMTKSVTIYRKQDAGKWMKDCKDWYMASDKDNPFRCEVLATPSYSLASLAEEILNPAMAPGLWVVHETVNGIVLRELDQSGKFTETVQPTNVQVEGA